MNSISNKNVAPIHQHVYRKSGTFSKVAISSLIILAVWISPRALAQQNITTPNRSRTSVNSDEGIYNIHGGEASADGGNLFHEFSQFNLDAGERANFITDDNIHNVLGRITGGEPSSINGLIQLTGGNANLYLINPTGIIFGPEARLDVPSSFFATTADHLRFGENLLDVYNSIDFSELTGDPTGFIFTSDRVGAIVNLGELQVPNGDLALLGGTVISTGSLSAPEGRIIITAVEGGNEVNINYDGSPLTLSIQRTDILNNSDENVVPVTSLPELLAGSDFSDEASELVVKEDGSVWLTSSSNETQASEIELNRDGVLYINDIYFGRHANFLYRYLINSSFWTNWQPDVSYKPSSSIDPGLFPSVQNTSNLVFGDLFYGKDPGLIPSVYRIYELEPVEDAPTTLNEPSESYSNRFIFSKIDYIIPLRQHDPSPIDGLAPPSITGGEQNQQNISITFDSAESHGAGQSLDSRREIENSPNFPLSQIDLDSLDDSESSEIPRALNSISQPELEPVLNVQPVVIPSDFRFTSEIDPATFIIERTPWYIDSDVLLPSPSLDNLLILSSQETSS